MIFDTSRIFQTGIGIKGIGIYLECSLHIARMQPARQDKRFAEL